MTLFEKYEEEREAGRREGRREGREEGEFRKLVTQVCRKLRKRKAIGTIADELEEREEVIAEICEAAAAFAPDYPEKEVFAAIRN